MSEKEPRTGLDLIRPALREFGDSWGCNPLEIWDTLCAARDGDAKKLRELLARDANLYRAEFWYTQPIHFAVREGHIDAAQVLLDAGADPTTVRYGGQELATLARDRGHEDMARLIEAARARYFPAAPAPHEIHQAAKAGNSSRVRELVEEDNSLVDVRDSEGSTPLHHAVANGSLELVGYLLDSGADIQAVSGTGGTYHGSGFSPIDTALWSNGFLQAKYDWRMAGYLLGRGAHYSVAMAAAAGDLTEVKRLVAENGERVNEPQPCGRRPLSVAVEAGQDEVARFLLENGADPNLPEGRYAGKGIALHAASRLKNKAMVKLLLEKGADPESYIDSCGSAWHWGDAEIRLMLYQHGLVTEDFDLQNIDALAIFADKDPKSLGEAGCGGVFAMVVMNEWGEEAKIRFPDEKKEAILRMLLAKGVRVPQVLTGCKSYLWHKPKLTRILLEHGMNPNLPNWQWVTPLHEICNKGERDRVDANRAELLDLFLEFGADINARDEEYRSTPLGWAARSGLQDMVKLLLARGAKTNLPDDEPWATPLAWAQKRGHDEIAEMLRAHGATA